MSAHTDLLFAHAAKVKAARETESLEIALVALDKALASYDAMPTSRNAYNIAAARDRVKAAQAREMVAPWLQCEELRQEWRENGGA